MNLAIFGRYQLSQIFVEQIGMDNNIADSLSRLCRYNIYIVGAGALEREILLMSIEL